MPPPASSSSSSTTCRQRKNQEDARVHWLAWWMSDVWLVGRREHMHGLLAAHLDGGAGGQEQGAGQGLVLLSHAHPQRHERAECQRKKEKGCYSRPSGRCCAAPPGWCGGSCGGRSWAARCCCSAAAPGSAPKSPLATPATAPSYIRTRPVSPRHHLIPSVPSLGADPLVDPFTPLPPFLGPLPAGQQRLTMPPAPPHLCALAPPRAGLIDGPLQRIDRRADGRPPLLRRRRVQQPASRPPAWSGGKTDCLLTRHMPSAHRFRSVISAIMSSTGLVAVGLVLRMCMGLLPPMSRPKASSSNASSSSSSGTDIRSSDEFERKGRGLCRPDWKSTTVMDGYLTPEARRASVWQGVASHLLVHGRVLLRVGCELSGQVPHGRWRHGDKDMERT